MFKRGAFLALTIISGLFINTAVVTHAQAANETSRLVPFQGRLHGTDNKAVSDGVYDITFNIYDTPTGGTPAWTESHTQVSVIHGYVNVLLGAINAMHDVNYANVTATPAYDASKNNVDFTTKKFLGISINGGVEMFPRSQLVPSFHAFTANHADHATQADNADNLGGKAASTYAQLTHVASEDTILNNRITAVSNGLDTDVGSASSRINTLEGYFNRADPVNPKANNTDKLNGYADTHFATQSDMTDIKSRFTGNVANNANTLDSKDSLYFATAAGLTSANTNISSLQSKFSGEKANKAVLADSATNSGTLDNIDSTEFLRIKTTGSSTDPNTTTSGYILTNHVNSPGMSRFWHIDTRFYSSIGGDASQHAISYNGTGTLSFVRHKYSSVWQSWVRTDSNAKFEDRVQAGTVIIWPANSLPLGYEHCNGQALSKTTYPDLYAIIGYTYGGSGDSFNAPDYRGQFLRGWANGSTKDPGRNTRTGGDNVGSTQADSLKKHRHVVKSSGDAGSGGGLARGSSSNDGTEYSEYVGDSETRPTNIAVKYIIKAKNF